MTIPTRKSERKEKLIKSALDSQRSGFELEKALREFSLCFFNGFWGGAVLFFFYEIF